jgi:hypothetical protein
MTDRFVQKSTAFLRAHTLWVILLSFFALLLRLVEQWQIASRLPETNPATAFVYGLLNDAGFILSFGFVLGVPLLLLHYWKQKTAFDRARRLAFSGAYEPARLLCRKVLAGSSNYHDVRVLYGRTFAWEKIIKRRWRRLPWCCAETRNTKALTWRGLMPPHGPAKRFGPVVVPESPFCSSWQHTTEIKTGQPSGKKLNPVL